MLPRVSWRGAAANTCVTQSALRHPRPVVSDQRRESATALLLAAAEHGDHCTVPATSAPSDTHPEHCRHRISAAEITLDHGPG